jgi:DNA-binding transcriptional regulator YdaS (Cro superfamily)
VLKKEAAALLGVTPARVSQLIRDRYLVPEADGSVSEAAVERCRRSVAWQHPGMKSGRKSAAQHESERRDRLWYSVAVRLRGQGYRDWQCGQVRQTWRDFRAAIIAVAPELIED